MATIFGKNRVELLGNKVQNKGISRGAFLKMLVVGGMALIIKECIPAVGFMTEPLKTLAAGKRGPAFIVSQGVNLNRPFLGVHKINRGDYSSIAYNDAPEQSKQKIIELTKQYGFGTIRINAGVLPLLEGRPNDVKEQLGVLDTFISSALSSGLKVILSLHTLESTGIWTSTAILSDPSGKSQQAYRDMVAFVAHEESKRNSAEFALALFNEPPTCHSDKDFAQWSDFQEKLYTAARQSAPNLTLILTGPCFSAVNGIVKIDPEPYDENTIFDMHFYEPTIFTQQGNYGGQNYTNYVHRLGFPPNKAQKEEFLLHFHKEEKAADLPLDLQLKFENWVQHDADEYFNKGANLVTQRLNTFFQWARSHQISPQRLMVGEFGVRRDYLGHVAADESDRLRWLSAVRGQIEANDAGWVFYALIGPWGLTSEDMSEPADPQIFDALNLKRPVH